jgi:CRISPR system Cascade subunit CasE
MYLSRLILNRLSAQVRAELARPYEMHRTLLRAFPQDVVHKERDDDDAAGVLFRVDEQPRTNNIAVLVQSRSAPDWAYLNDKRDARGHAYLQRPPETKSFDPLARLTAGQMLAFRLRANPTKRLGSHARDENGKRVGLRDEQEQLAWLQRKADAGGFRILRAMVSRDEHIEDKTESPRGNEKAQRHLEFVSVQFDGVLQVVSADDLGKAIARGIGSGKGFGFGLLSLAPA